MDIQNKSNTYMTNNALPSYEEATSTQPYAPNTNNPEFNPGYPYIVGSSLSTPFPHLSNSYPNSTPIQSTYPQNHPTTVIYRRQLIRRNSEDIDTCRNCVKCVCILIIFIVLGTTAVAIIRITQ